MEGVLFVACYIPGEGILILPCIDMTIGLCYTLRAKCFFMATDRENQGSVPNEDVAVPPAAGVAPGRNGATAGETNGNGERITRFGALKVLVLPEGTPTVGGGPVEAGGLPLSDSLVCDPSSPNILETLEAAFARVRVYAGGDAGDCCGGADDIKVAVRGLTDYVARVLGGPAEWNEKVETVTAVTGRAAQLAIAGLSAAENLATLSARLSLRLQAAQAYVAAVTEAKEKAEIDGSTDKLTGLWTQGAFKDYAPKLFDYCRGNNVPMAYLKFDIDFMHHANTVFGHTGGDTILSTVGGIIKEAFRFTDFSSSLSDAKAAREGGGEEFGVLLAGTDLQGAIVAAERVRKRIEETDFGALGVNFTSHDGLKIPAKITVSIGVGAVHSNDGSFDGLSRRTDSALYHSKNTGGRNSLSSSECLEDGSSVLKCLTKREDKKVVPVPNFGTGMDVSDGSR